MLDCPDCDRGLCSPTGRPPISLCERQTKHQSAVPARHWRRKKFLDWWRLSNNELVRPLTASHTTTANGWLDGPDVRRCQVFLTFAWPSHRLSSRFHTPFLGDKRRQKLPCRLGGLVTSSISFSGGKMKLLHQPPVGSSSPLELTWPPFACVLDRVALPFPSLSP